MFDKKEPQAGEWIEVQAHGQTVLIRGGGSELRAEVARLKEALKESAGQISIRDEVIKKQAAQIQWINTKRAEAEDAYAALKNIQKLDDEAKLKRKVVEAEERRFAEICRNAARILRNVPSVSNEQFRAECGIPLSGEDTGPKTLVGNLHAAERYITRALEQSTSYRFRGPLTDMRGAIRRLIWGD